MKAAVWIFTACLDTKCGHDMTTLPFGTEEEAAQAEREWLLDILADAHEPKDWSGASIEDIAEAALDEVECRNGWMTYGYSRYEIEVAEAILNTGQPPEEPKGYLVWTGQSFMAARWHFAAGPKLNIWRWDSHLGPGWANAAIKGWATPPAKVTLV